MIRLAKNPARTQSFEFRNLCTTMFIRHSRLKRRAHFQPKLFIEPSKPSTLPGSSRTTNYSLAKIINPTLRTALPTPPPTEKKTAWNFLNPAEKLSRTALLSRSILFFANFHLREHPGDALLMQFPLSSIFSWARERRSIKSVPLAEWKEPGQASCPRGVIKAACRARGIIHLIQLLFYQKIRASGKFGHWICPTLGGTGQGDAL